MENWLKCLVKIQVIRCLEIHYYNIPYFVSKIDLNSGCCWVLLRPIFSINRHILYGCNYIDVLSVYSEQISKSLLYIKVFSSQFESL